MVAGFGSPVDRDRGRFSLFPGPEHFRYNREGGTFDCEIGPKTYSLFPFELHFLHLLMDRKNAVFPFSRMLLILFICSVSYGSAVAESPFTERVEELREEYNIRHDHLGIRIQKGNTESPPLIDRNGEDVFLPASNQKLLTAGGALYFLGTDYTYETKLYLDREKRNGGGHLYIVGSGDPSLSERFFEGSGQVLFERWADRLQRQNVDRIRGDIVLDDSLYEGPAVHPTWNRDDLIHGYAAPVSPFIIDGNQVDLIVRPGQRSGTPVRVERHPPLSPVRIHSTARTISRDRHGHIQFEQRARERAIRISGTFPVNGGARRQSVAVLEPVRHFGEMMRRVFEREGIDVTGEVRTGTLSGEMEARSPDLIFRSDLLRSLRVMLEESQNVYAEAIVHQISAVHEGTGSWRRTERLMGRFLRAVTDVQKEFKFADGSGLSRSNRVSPRTLVSVLEWWKEHPLFETYIRMLPESRLSGTLEHRLTNLPPGAVRGKTGTLSGVTALSGFLFEEGRPLSDSYYTFSILINENRVSAGRARAFIRRVLGSLYRRKFGEKSG